MNYSQFLILLLFVFHIIIGQDIDPCLNELTVQSSFEEDACSLQAQEQVKFYFLFKKKVFFLFDKIPIYFFLDIYFKE